VLYVAWPWIVPDSNKLRSDYYVWRLVKANATSIEQNRARSNLLALMNVKDSSIREPATRDMVQALRQPGLPVERIDLLLQSLLESRIDGDLNLPKQLVGSLRSASVDARTRINDVLKHLANNLCSKKFDEKDKVWKPSDGDATVSLELRIKAWSDYWTSSCKSNTSGTPKAQQRVLRLRASAVRSARFDSAPPLGHLTENSARRKRAHVQRPALRH
jgi:hypothetical protein